METNRPLAGKEDFAGQPGTEAQYLRIVGQCRELFGRKAQDYGTAWRALRLPSVTDQLYIKAMRIRSVQDKGAQQVADDLQGEFVGIVNYCAIALMQMGLGPDEPFELPAERVIVAYGQVLDETFALMRRKNHDYGEAWRQMRVSSIADLILMKILRVKRIEDNAGQTVASEGVAANYQDMLNYAVFALILIEEGADAMV